MELLTEKNENLLGTGIAVGTGILGWELAATLKYALPNDILHYSGGIPYSPFSQQRFADAVAGLIGNGMTKKIFPSWTGAADFKPNLMGFLNKITYTGAALLIADKILSNVKQYRDFPLAQTIISNAGKGLTVGGIVGGIFDPDPNSPAPRANAAQGTAYNVPNPRINNQSQQGIGW
jgi:hypothetical protein